MWFGDRDLRRGNWGQGTWDRELGAGKWDRELGQGTGGQQTGDRELGQTGDRDLGTAGGRELGQGTGDGNWGHVKQRTLLNHTRYDDPSIRTDTTQVNSVTTVPIT